MTVADFHLPPALQVSTCEQAIEDWGSWEAGGSGVQGHPWLYISCRGGQPWLYLRPWVMVVGLATICDSV